MAGSSKELGFPKSSCVSSLREQLARTTLRNVRLKGHSYVELREDNKKPIFFCVLCLSPCHSDSVLHDHLRGHLHKKMYEAAKSTLLKENPWPFNDGMLFFHSRCDENDRLLISNANFGSNLLQSESIDKSSLAIVTTEGNESACDFTSERSLSSLGDDESLDADENGYDLVIPNVMLKDIVSDLEVKSIGLGKIAVRTYQKDGVTKGISRIWCEWLGDCHANQEDIIPPHDFAIVSFAFNYDMGRKGLLDDMLFLPSSYTRPALQENKKRKGKKRKSLSDPEDVSESLSNQLESLGEEFQASGSSGSRIPSRSVRKELRVHRRLASERVCDICQHKMLPGKDVATLLNMKTGRLVCSSRNLNGAFHVFHISCLIHWVLFCDYEVYTKQLIGPKVKKRYRRKKGAKTSEAEKEVRKQIYSAFCPECQGTGIDIDGDELEKPTVSLSEMFKYKMKASDGHREYTKCPEMLQNCSTGFYFPPQSEGTMQEYVSSLKMLRFYRAAE
ncbi:hypothetical protein L6452_19365 [Arctium lappa]|uniref:Uncharacterized protein n=1 Tax=Arctium lappa TaxID=4217 RepID=A0ACB9B8D6_ARCLA|nr:hypothetical protein L6452_19365 [Arctium lappa]